MSTALRGNLKDFGIAEVFQLIGQQGKTGLLEIEADGQKYRLAFDQGSVVCATPVGETDHDALGDQLVRCGLLTRERLTACIRECQSSARSLASLLASAGELTSDDLEAMVDLLTRDTIFQVLRLAGGSFHFSAQAVENDRPRHKLLGAEQILMDGLRMADEWRTFIDLVPNTEMIFERRGNLDQVRQASLGGNAERVFQLVDGRLTVRRVIDLSRLGTFEATHTLAELHRTGMIQASDQTAVSRLTSKLASTGSVMDGALEWAAAAVPVALLALLVAASYQLAPTRTAGSTFPIMRSPTAHAQQVFETRRLRNALQAERLLTATWPTDLGQLSRTRNLGGAALARAAARPYYYARHEDGIVLLAPER